LQPSNESVSAAARGRLLDWGSGGLWLFIAALMCLSVVVLWWQRVSAFEPPPGDGRNPATYGFDLSTCLVSQDLLVGGGFAKDAMPAMVDPEILTIAESEALERQLRKTHQGKLLVDSDRVIGVTIGDEARAYPLKTLNWHEVVNDTLGGVPIVVTYHPLCDSAVVFDRRVNDEVREFHVSGLLYESNLVMFDAQEDPSQESLWCQLQFRAIAGPAAEAGATLVVLPAVVTTWGAWHAQYPETTILGIDRSRSRIYKKNYEPYFDSDDLLFPVDPPPPADGPPAKTRIIAVRGAAGWQVMPAAEYALPLDGCDAPTVHAFWFAWHAQHPDVPLVTSTLATLPAFDRESEGRAPAAGGRG
jgi:hypothetical protein